MVKKSVGMSHRGPMHGYLEHGRRLLGLAHQRHCHLGVAGPTVHMVGCISSAGVTTVMMRLGT